MHYYIKTNLTSLTSLTHLIETTVFETTGFNRRIRKVKESCTE